MRSINLLYHGEGWTESVDAHLIDEHTVAFFTVKDSWLGIIRFPQSLKTETVVEYFPGDNEVEYASIYFERFPNFKAFDVTQPLAEIIINLLKR